VTTDLDFGLDGLDPADVDSAQAEGFVWAGDLTVLAEHHTPDRSRSFIVAHDKSAAWGVPGAPEVAAIAITRDLEQGAFTFAFAYHATHPFAQAWLIERGCPPGQIVLPDGVYIDPADDLTRELEEKIRDGGRRYIVLDAHTRGDGPSYESWTMARDTTADQAPIRVFLEESVPAATAYTLREGAFPDEDAARDWLDHRDSPLPKPHERRVDTDALRVRAAAALSTTPPPPPARGHDRSQSPSAPAVPPPSPGRSL
jgi:hypothetical protein